MSSRWSKMTDAEKKAYYAARKARRAKVAKAKAKPETAAKQTKKGKQCNKHLSPEERLLKAVGIEPPRYCDAELALSRTILPYRMALRAQAKKVGDECRTIIDAVARLMREFDKTVYGVSITNVREVPEDVLKADKKASKKVKK